MESQMPQPPQPQYGAPPPFSPLTESPLKTSVMSHTSPMDAEMAQSEYDRSQRAVSVLSGMSIEDMEAAETLNSLFNKSHSPHKAQAQQAPPTHIRTTTSFNGDEPEPLLSLLTSSHPLAAPLIHGSLSTYKTVQSYIPGAEWTERNLGLPLAGTIGRVTGVEGGLRWALQRTQSQGQPEQTRTSDVEKGFAEVAPVVDRRSSELSYGETLPAYSAGDRSPPYTEQQLVLQNRERQPPPGWQHRLVVSTSGLGVAMSEESLRSLKYCLGWLRWANERLGGAVQSLREILQRWNEGAIRQEQQPMSLAVMTQSSEESRQAAMTARIAALKAEVLDTLKQVVGVVSNYAGGALPENARNLVHRHLTSLPQRFNIASARASNANADNGNETASSAYRVMVLAQEGLDMMTQVSGVVNDTLVSAESWCEKLGRRKRQDPQQEHQTQTEKDEDGWNRSVTVGSDADADADVKMEM